LQVLYKQISQTNKQFYEAELPLQT